jgi:hypothetical protein
MPTPISYLSGNTLSYQSGMVKKGTIGLNLTSSLTGNYRWWNGVDATSSQYLIYSDTYSTGASSESNVTPAAWSTPDLTDTSLLNLINTLPDRVGQTAFTSLSDALIWLNQSGKYFLVKNGYENLVTSGLTLNLDAGWTNSYSGTTSWHDISGNGKTGTLTNGPAFNSGNTGSIYFDGTDDFCVVPSSSLNGLSSGSISVWVKFLNLNFQYVLSLPNSGGNNGFDILIENGKLDSYLQATNSAGSTGSQFVPKLGIWYNIVTTYDGTTHKLFVNGVFISSVGRSGTIQNGIGQTFLGRFSSAFGAYSNNYTSNAQLYNRALTQTEILQNYQLYKNRFGYDVVENGLVLNLNAQNYVSYRETGTSWYDLTGNNNTGTLTNGPTFDSTTRSVVFDGVDDYVTTSGNIGISGATARTLECWYYADSTLSKSILGYGGNSQSNLFDTMTWNNGQNIIGHYYGGNYDTISTLPPRVTINQNKWNHIIHMYDGTNVSIYTNGVFSNSKEFSVSNNSQLNTNNSTFKIGTGQFTGAYEYAKGKISGARIYNKVLSQSEILQNYYQGNIVTNGLVLNLDAGNLVSYDGTGTLWNDLTNTTTGATLMNGPTYTTSNGGGIVFDGSDDYGRLPSTSSVDVNTFTWSAFVKGIYSNTPGLFFIGSDVGQSITPYKIFIGVQNAGGVYKLRVNYNNVATVNLGSLVDNTLYNLVITYNGTTTNMYVNGELIGTSNAMSGNLTSKTYTYIASTQGQYEFFNGTVYNTLFYNRALTQSEVIQNFNAHKSRYGL